MDNLYENQEENTLDLQTIFNLVRQWAWVVVLAALIAGVTAYFVSRQMTPVYQATTTVLINEAPSTKATDYTSVMTSERLARTYAEMFTKRPVLQGVIDALGLQISTDGLAGSINVALVRDTQLISVSVENTNPVLAANIADALVAVFTRQVLETQTARYASSKESLETQMSAVELQLNTLRGDLAAARTATDKDRLEEKIVRYEQSYNNLALSYEQVRLTEAQTISSVVPVESAGIPTEPVSPKTMQNTLLAAVVGAMLAAGVIFLVETFNDVIRDPDEIVKRFQLPILAIVGTYAKPEDGPITQLHPRAYGAEAFRVLRTNIFYSGTDNPMRTLLITSPTPSEGKTTISANLAVVCAQSGKSTVLIDADLHRPRVHQIFKAPNRGGLSSLLVQPEVEINNVMQDTKTPDLKLISSGPIITNPSELLSSRKMRSLLKQLENQTDIVVIDSPPVLSVTDAIVLAPHVDGVLLVVKPGKTNLRIIKQSLEQIQRVGGTVIGVVLNEVEVRKSRTSYYYPGYHKYRQHYDEYVEERKNGHGKKEKLAFPWSKKN
jgi:non-specific protein-tyrosine kinase